MLCLLTFEISEDRDGKNFYTGVHGILVLFGNKYSDKCPSRRIEGWLLIPGVAAYSRARLFDNSMSRVTLN